MELILYLKILVLLTSSKWFQAKATTQYYIMNFCDWTFNMHERHLDEALFGLTSSGVHGADVDCQMQVMTSPGRQLSFKVLEMNLQDGHDSVSFYSGNSTDDSDAVSPQLCTRSADTYHTTESGSIMRLQANGHTGSFLVQITSFYTQEGTCMSGDFSCGNGLCIREKLYCNERDNCGDSSDETDCDEDDDKWWLPIPLSIGGFFFLIFLCHLKKKQEQRKIAILKAEEEKKNAAARKAKEKRKKAETKKEEEEKKKAEELKKSEEKEKAEVQTKAMDPNIEVSTATTSHDPVVRGVTSNDVITTPSIWTREKSSAPGARTGLSTSTNDGSLGTSSTNYRYQGTPA